jgi:hypothetical protein
VTEREVCSPVSRPGSKVGSGQPLSPGARSSLHVGSGVAADSATAVAFDSASQRRTFDDGGDLP